jgi:hypothetical protein
MGQSSITLYHIQMPDPCILNSGAINNHGSADDVKIPSWLLDFFLTSKPEFGMLSSYLASMVIKMGGV